MRTAKLAMLGLAAAALALTMAPSAFAYTGTLVCITPASCAGGTIALNGPGSSATAHYWLRSNAPGGTTINYYVCPSSASSCSAASGSDNGWSWSWTPTSGTTGTSSQCSAVPATSCEGNGDGSASTLSLQITAPSVVTSSNSQEELSIYACSVSGTTQTCAGIFQNVAAASITATVPQFPLGVGVVVVVGLLGLVLVRRKGLGFSKPTASI